MDQVERVKKLREEYERALDAAESRRLAYHDAVLELYQGGVPLREIAKELGLSHQRVHQIVSDGAPPSRSKLPRAAGGAAGVVLVIAALTFGGLRLAHVPPFAERSSAPPHLSVAFRSRKGFMPGGAVFRRKREVLARATPLGRVSLWTAPDRVSRTAHCSWLQIGLFGNGGTCWQPSARGIATAVPLRYELMSPRDGRTASLPLIWGRVSARVARLTVSFRDGSHTTFQPHDGMFLYAAPVTQSRWERGHVPAFIVAHDSDGNVVDKRPFRPGTAFHTPFSGPAG